jgi:type II secretory pathway component PulM
LEPHQLLAWVDSLLNEVEEFIKKECADIQEDQEMADFIFDSFTAQWPELKNMGLRGIEWVE